MATSFSKKKNNAYSTLLSSHVSGSGTIVIQVGDQSKFPATFPFRITVYQSTLDRSTGTIFQVNSASTNTFNVTIPADESPTSVDQNFTISGLLVFNVELDWTYAQATQYETAINTAETNIATLQAKFPIQTADIGDSQVTTAKLTTKIQQGWNDPGTTFTYASATSFTTGVNLSSTLQKGDKIELTQTTTKYFYVTAVSGTTVTVTGGTDYTLANAAITSPYYSKETNPVGFPSGFNLTSSNGAQVLSMSTNGYASIRGWGFVTASGTPSNIQQTVTFGITYSAAPIVVSSYIGRSSSDFTGPSSGSAGVQNCAVGPSTTTTTQFIADVWPTGNAGNTLRYGYTWIAVGQI